jgi:hypothetical protein
MLCLAALWTGCEPASKAPPPDSNPVGTYALVSVDGKAVPCSATHDGRNLEIKSGSFVISADGTCSSKITMTKPGGGDATIEVKATYTRQGATLNMKWERAGTTTGTVAGDTFTMTNEGMVFAYRKQ